MTVLVTGGAGYIGSHVVRQLTESGNEVVVLDNLSTGFADALINGEKLIVADLADTGRVEEVFRGHRIDAVMHFAASVVVPESIEKPLEYFNNNAVNVIRLVDACLRHDVKRVVFSSTAAVYGSPESGVASEETPAAPINPYGASKLMGESVLRDASRAHGLNCVTLRYFNVAGADRQARMGQRTERATHLIKVCCEAALRQREQVEIFGVDYPTPDGTGVRDYIHVEDLASAHLAALDYLRSRRPSVTLNVGYGAGHSVREVISAVRKASGVSFPAIEAQRRPGDPASLVADAAKIREVLGWLPRHASLEQIVADTWRWESRQGRVRTGAQAASR
jgi:UDP-glucose 4-epimerase